MMCALESLESIKIICQAVKNLPEGPGVTHDWEMKDTDIIESRIEVPRGTLYQSYALERGRVRHSIIRTPSMANNGAKQYACIGDQITDAQLCIVQCDPCFTCTDRAIEVIRRLNHDAKYYFLFYFGSSCYSSCLFYCKYIFARY